MGKTLNVLSIDFDLFQTVKPDIIRNLYPDPIDLPTYLSAEVWAAKYASAEEELLSVKADTDRIREAEDIIRHNCLRAEAMIANSHVHIHNFILNEYYSGKYEAINLVNADMHHDCVNSNTELDCGNWISHVKKAVPDTFLTWIANPISETVYELTDEFRPFIKTDFTDVRDTEFDLLYLCRSDNWVPPHLDAYFRDLAQTVIFSALKTYSERGVTGSRWDDGFRRSYADIRDAVEKAYADIHRKDA